MTTCPHCGGQCCKDGRTKANTQRYRCKACKRRHSASGLAGRPALGDQAMTDAERQRRWRERQKGGDSLSE